jgi:sigma-B regulation protein RsbU (phosphoserine phosphatase)
VRWQDHTLRLKDGATLVAYTDGITDALSEDGERFGLGRLCDTLRGLGGRPAGEVIQGMTRALDEFQSGAHADDTAAIALHRLACE